jgi:hypothetical protein
MKVRHLAGRLLCALALVGWSLSSCTYHTNDYDPLDVPDDVSFEQDIIPIFEESCNTAGCHSGTIPPDLRPEYAYNSLWLGEYIIPGEPAENTPLYQSIDGGTMTSYATDLERAYIEKWINEGAENN